MPLWLCTNAVAQVFVACLLGWTMLIPMQPWGKRWRELVPPRAMLAAHLDWIMLGLTQVLAAFAFTRITVAHPNWIFGLLIFGGWINPIPYLLRGKGLDAFVFAGQLKQRLATTLSGVSSLALTVAWGMLLVQLVGACLAQG